MKSPGKSLLTALFTLITFYSRRGSWLVGYDAESILSDGISGETFYGTKLMMKNPASISILSSSMVKAEISLMFRSMNFEYKIKYKVIITPHRYRLHLKRSVWQMQT